MFHTHPNVPIAPRPYSPRSDITLVYQPYLSDLIVPRSDTTPLYTPHVRSQITLMYPPHVPHHIAPLGVTTLTHPALERFLARMNPHVSGQMGR
ncbi:hypothetical protein DPMN_091406 [Dreissena polymorpha]|uniref:Uncharacterized protein n=1 Tax=Dreissena polymorpha TaxID=45954 RepID=A0A9D4KZU6_DREPO|nr:hypothetical protein DPMN_091406 [Dreissena polymorpha]